MTPEAQRQITLFETRVRQALLLIDELRAENARLRTTLEERDVEIELLKEEVERQSKRYDTLKMARVIDITDKEKAQVRQRLGALIREVDKCINIVKN